MNSMTAYINEISRLVSEVGEKQADVMEKAAVLMADALCSDGFVYTFGTGHSHILAEEIFYRAGGLARVYPILEDALMLHTHAARSSMFERTAGLAALLLDDRRRSPALPHLLPPTRVVCSGTATMAKAGT